MKFSKVSFFKYDQEKNSAGCIAGRTLFCNFYQTCRGASGHQKLSNISDVKVFVYTSTKTF